MMPTLVAGDFIFVNKYAYGLHLPVLNTPLFSVGNPERGDVVVFHHPMHPEINLIKRLVGLPGDRIEIKGDAIWVNDTPVSVSDTGPFVDDACYRGFRAAYEHLGTHEHTILYCPSRPQSYSGCTASRPLTACPATSDSKDPSQDSSPAPQGTFVVPAGEYFFMGDNRDNSGDSRFANLLGYVPRDHIVGRAQIIGASVGVHSGSWWNRIFKPIH
jgi:signal peptidase I